MSDNNKDKSDEYDAIFSSSSDMKPEHESFDEVEADFTEVTDIDDGSDPDSDEGIFAPSVQKEKGASKSSGLLGVVALLAVAGAGGYVYLSNPEMISQVMQNVMGEEETGAASSAPIAQAQPPQIEKPVPQDNPEVVGVPEEEIVPPAPSPVVEDIPVEQQAAVEMPTDEVPVPPAEVSEPVDASTDVVAVAPPVAETEMPKQEDLPAPSAEPVAPVSVPPVDTVSAAIPAIKPVEEVKKAEPKIETAQKEESPIIIESKEVQQKVEADAKLDKYFDSPGGKMLSTIKAPAMNPDKGNNESLIVVNKVTKTSPPKPSKSAQVSIKTTDLDSRIVAANRALKLGRYDAARDMYEELYRLNPRDERILMGRAVLFQKTGEEDRAISAYESVLQSNPDNAEAVVNLAGLVRKQYPAVALSKLIDLRQKYPNNPVIIAQLGVAHADSGNFQDAFHYLSMAASLEPTNPQHFYNMAVVSEKAGDAQKAVSYYEKALEVDAIYGDGRKVISREVIYDRLARLRGD